MSWGNPSWAHELLTRLCDATTKPGTMVGTLERLAFVSLTSWKLMKESGKAASTDLKQETLSGFRSWRINKIELGTIGGRDALADR